MLTWKDTQGYGIELARCTNWSGNRIVRKPAKLDPARLP